MRRWSAQLEELGRLPLVFSAWQQQRVITSEPTTAPAWGPFAP